VGEASGEYRVTVTPGFLDGAQRLVVWGGTDLDARYRQAIPEHA
jgi:hypothetical protein